jgi:hypothetical protein
MQKSFARRIPLIFSRLRSNKIKMVVFSKHLSLSSSVFRTLLNNKMQEGDILQREKSLKLTLDDDDTFAFALIMNIIHARNNLLPDEVTFATLVNLAILVDKYNFNDSVTLWARRWATNLQIKVPKTICDKSACCIVCPGSSAY